MTELVTIIEVREAYLATQKKSIKTIIDRMEELSQGKIERSVLDAAKAVVECACGNVLASPPAEEGDKCQFCEREERLEKEQQKLQAKFVALCEELNELNPSGVPGKPTYYVDNNVIQREEGDHYCKIIRDAIYSRYRHSHKSALRIYTDQYNTKADRLTRDFGVTGLAKALDLRCTQLFDQMKKKENERAARVKTVHEKEMASLELEQEIQTMFQLTDKVPIERDFYRSNSKNRHGEIIFTGYMKFKYGVLTLRTKDCKEFSVAGINKVFTVEQVKTLADTLAGCH